MRQDKLPNLLIAGVTKAGTTSLFAYLVQHPNICGSLGKGTAYFSPLLYEDATLPPLHDYANHFKHCESQTYRLEATLNYWYGGARVISAIKSHLNDPRVVISLRDPVDRLWSSYKMHKGRGTIARTTSFASYVGECERLWVEGNDLAPNNRHYRALRTGTYSAYFTEWAEALGDHLRIVFFEDLVADPMTVVSDLCHWLEIDEQVCREFDYSVHNKAVVHRSGLVQRLAMRLNGLGWRLLRRQPRLHESLRNAYELVNASQFKEEIDPGTRQHLEDFYRGSNEQLVLELSELGYERLPSWLRRCHRETREGREAGL